MKPPRQGEALESHAQPWVQNSSPILLPSPRAFLWVVALPKPYYEPDPVCRVSERISANICQYTVLRTYLPTHEVHGGLIETSLLPEVCMHVHM